MYYNRETIPFVTMPYWSNLRKPNNDWERTLNLELFIVRFKGYRVSFYFGVLDTLTRQLLAIIFILLKFYLNQDFYEIHRLIGFFVVLKVC